MSPLNASCFIWSRKMGLASIVCRELVDKRATPKGSVSLQGHAKAPQSQRTSGTASGASGARIPKAASRGLCLSLSAKAQEGCKPRSKAEGAKIQGKELCGNEWYYLPVPSPPHLPSPSFTLPFRTPAHRHCKPHEGRNLCWDSHA